jgi:hypothetical protein
VPSAVHSNKRLMEYIQEQEYLRRDEREREGMVAIQP